MAAQLVVDVAKKNILFGLLATSVFSIQHLIVKTKLTQHWKG